MVGDGGESGDAEVFFTELLVIKNLFEVF